MPTARATAATVPCAALRAPAADHRWVLQADIRLYFPSIDHRILRRPAGRAHRLPRHPLRLLDQILANGASAGPAIDGFPGDTLLTPLERPRGLPIGNLTSQFLANLHLDRSRPRHARPARHRAYLRYVDDMALFADRHRSRSASAPGKRIEADLAALRLRLHPSKSQLRRCRGRQLRGVPRVAAAASGCATTTCCRIRLRLRSLQRGAWLPGASRLSQPAPERSAGMPTSPMAIPAACAAACLRPTPSAGLPHGCPTLIPRAGRPAAARRLLVQRSAQLPRRVPEQQPPGQRQHQHRRSPLLSPPPSTLHRQSRWKGFQRECTKGPDPLQ